MGKYRIERTKNTNTFFLFDGGPIASANVHQINGPTIEHNGTVVVLLLLQLCPAGLQIYARHGLIIAAAVVVLLLQFCPAGLQIYARHGLVIAVAVAVLLLLTARP